MSSKPGLAILIVDDDARIRELTAAAAQRTGLYTSVVTTEGPPIALELLQRDTESLPDLVLTDLSMPGMDGLEFTRLLRSDTRWSQLPIVMFSSSDRPNDREDALAAGCVAFFEKPPTLGGLQDLLAELPALIQRTAMAK